MVVYLSNFKDSREITVELQPKDKWWLKKLIEYKKINIDTETEIEVEFFFDKKDKEKIYPIPILDDKTQPEYIEIFPIEVIEEILKANSRAKNFYYQIIEL